jgi:hypothetical protein
MSLMNLAIMNKNNEAAVATSDLDSTSGPLLVFVLGAPSTCTIHNSSLTLTQSQEHPVQASRHSALH